MSSALPIESFKVENFHGLKKFELPKAGRINLLVGKNGVGKSTVLEAIRAYCAIPTAVRFISTIKRLARPASIFAPPQVVPSEIEDLFYGRPPIGLVGLPIKFSTSDMSFRLDFREKTGNVWGELTAYLADNWLWRWPLSFKHENSFEWEQNPAVTPHREYDSLFVSSAGLNEDQMARLWDFSVMHAKEDLLLELLSFLLPGVKRVSFVENKLTEARYCVIRKEGENQTIALSSLGEGVSRTLGIGLALVAARDGTLLVDELENGLHHSVQLEMWRFLLKTAKELNVQVFATTYSSDCLAAFAEASRENPELGIVSRVERRGDRIVAVQFTEEEAVTASRQLIEIR